MRMPHELAALLWIGLSRSSEGGAFLDRLASHLELARKRRRFWFDEGDGSLRRRCVIRLAAAVRDGEIVR